MKSLLLIILFFEYSAKKWQDGRTTKKWNRMKAQISLYISLGDILSTLSLSYSDSFFGTKSRAHVSIGFALPANFSFPCFSIWLQVAWQWAAVGLWIGIQSTILSHILATVTGPRCGHARTKGYMDIWYEFFSSTRIAKLALAASMPPATHRGPLCSPSVASTELGRGERQTDRQSTIWAEFRGAPEALLPAAHPSQVIPLFAEANSSRVFWHVRPPKFQMNTYSLQSFPWSPWLLFPFPVLDLEFTYVILNCQSQPKTTGNTFPPRDLVNLQIIFRGPLSRLLLSSECLWMLQPATELSQRQGNSTILLVYSLKEIFGQEYTFFFFFSNIEETSKNQAKWF